jgi:hypothetical protein
VTRSTDRRVTGERPKKDDVRGCLAVGCALALALVVFVAGGIYLSYARHVRRDDRLRTLVGEHLPIENLAARLREDPGYEMKSPLTWGDLSDLTAGFKTTRSPEVVAKRRQWPAVRAFKGPGVVAFVYFDAAGTAQDYVLVER